MPRDYTPLIDAASWTKPRPSSSEEAMKVAVDLLWKAFGHKPISWVGFYLKVGGAEEMVLVCREPKPACSPIGLHGMCGRSYLQKESILVADVRTLGENYIACDPKDQSELVIPLLQLDGRAKGVLDVDSYDVGAFDEADVQGMNRMLLALGLTHGASPVVRL
jgi:putative methionine-R-sulfoxide reductase with GAF domain